MSQEVPGTAEAATLTRCAHSDSIQGPLNARAYLQPSEENPAGKHLSHPARCVRGVRFLCPEIPEIRLQGREGLTGVIPVRRRYGNCWATRVCSC